MKNLQKKLKNFKKPQPKKFIKNKKLGLHKT